MSENANIITIPYSRVGELDVRLDIHLSPSLESGSKAAIVLFHGGGMVTGGRKTLILQRWLMGLCLTCLEVFD